MDDKKIGEKESLDAHIKLCERAWEQFNQRRKFEAQFSMAIWTALAVYLGFIITGRIGIIACSMRYWTWFALLFIIAIHILWLWWTNETNGLDKIIAYHHEGKIMHLIVDKFPKDIEDQKEAVNKLAWMRNSSVFITILLSTLILLATYSKTGSITPSTKRSGKNVCCEKNEVQFTMTNNFLDHH